MSSTHYRSPCGPGERDLQRLDILARQASDLIEQNQAEDALRLSQDQLARELSATQQLQLVSALLIQGATTEALCDKILDAAVAIMHSDMASLQMLDEHEDALRILASRGFDASFGQIFESVRSDTETSCGAAKRSGHRVVVPDVEKCDFIVSETALDHIPRREVERLTQPQACDRQQPEQAVIGPGPERVDGRPGFSRLQQCPDFVIGIEVWMSAFGPVRQQTRRRNLCRGIRGTPVPGEATHLGRLPAFLFAALARVSSRRGAYGSGHRSLKGRGGLEVNNWYSAG